LFLRRTPDASAQNERERTKETRVYIPGIIVLILVILLLIWLL
jgi:hypothetical protein